MHWIDWTILVIYLLAMLAFGLWLQRRASTGLDGYFVANRNMPGWLVGTSMVATTFAADTPLVVTGLVAKHGIAGNWLWWSLAFSHMMAAFWFARLWRRAEIITDAELIELRYDGRAAAGLRLFRAFFFAVPINCIIMGWVIRAMGKIVAVLFPWDQWMSAEHYQALVAIWPTGITIQTPSEALSILIGVILATAYAALGGLPTVIWTDLVQFSIAMLGSIVLAVVAVMEVGGLTSLAQRLEGVYGADASQILAFWPSGESDWLPLQAFLVYVLVQWWAQKFSDGGGIFVQRMSAARDEQHALSGASWFVVAHYALRPWPWILVGLVALVLYPLHGASEIAHAQMVASDREMAYPALMAVLLPVGLLGLMVTGMAAAFMSTIDTHVNWGAAYLVRDLYQRFMNPNATQVQLVRAGRWATLLIMFLALGVTTQIGSIANAWKFFTAMGSGLGLVTILRWLWWRINAQAELAGMVSAVVVAVVIYGLYPDDAIPFHVALLWVVGLSTVCVLATTLLTRPVAAEHLRAFYLRVRPPGRWGPVLQPGDPGALVPLRRMVASWTTGNVGLFAILFGVGEWLVGSSALGVLTLTAGMVIWLWTLRRARVSGHGAL